MSALREVSNLANQPLADPKRHSSAPYTRTVLGGAGTNENASGAFFKPRAMTATAGKSGAASSSSSGPGASLGYSLAPIPPSARSFHADAKHADKPEYCIGLIGEITETFLEKEKAAVRRFNEGTAAHNNDVSSLYAYFPSPHCLQYQPEVNEKMRMILIDWLIDVHLKFKLHHETIFLAVNLIDRYLSCVNTKHRSGAAAAAGGASGSGSGSGTATTAADRDYNTMSFVPRSQLQLVGVSAILLAAKYEEIWPPEIRECVHISANTYTREEIIRMERSICAALSFRLTVPTSYPFAMRLLTVLDGEDFLAFADSPDSGKLREYEVPERRALYTQQLRHATGFFLEHAMLDYKCLQFTPSQVGNAAVFLAIATLRIRHGTDRVGTPVWGELLQHYSHADLRDFRGCAEVMLEFVSYVPTTKYQAVRRKYNSSRYGEISKMGMPNELPSQ